MFEFIGIKLLLKYQPKTGKMLKDLKEFCASNDEFQADIANLRNDVIAFASRFDLPGNDEY